MANDGAPCCTGAWRKAFSVVCLLSLWCVFGTELQLSGISSWTSAFFFWFPPWGTTAAPCLADDSFVNVVRFPEDGFCYREVGHRRLFSPRRSSYHFGSESKSAQAAILGAVAEPQSSVFGARRPAETSEAAKQWDTYLRERLDTDVFEWGSISSADQVLNISAETFGSPAASKNLRRTGVDVRRKPEQRTAATKERLLRFVANREVESCTTSWTWSAAKTPPWRFVNLCDPRERWSVLLRGSSSVRESWIWPLSERICPPVHSSDVPRAPSPSKIFTVQQHNQERRTTTTSHHGIGTMTPAATVPAPAQKVSDKSENLRHRPGVLLYIIDNVFQDLLPGEFVENLRNSNFVFAATWRRMGPGSLTNMFPLLTGLPFLEKYRKKTWHEQREELPFLCVYCKQVMMWNGGRQLSTRYVWKHQAYKATSYMRGGT